MGVVFLNEVMQVSPQPPGESKPSPPSCALSAIYQ